MPEPLAAQRRVGLRRAEVEFAVLLLVEVVVLGDRAALVPRPGDGAIRREAAEGDGEAALLEERLQKPPRLVVGLSAAGQGAPLLRAAIPAVAAVRSVEPNLGDGPVVVHQIRPLLVEIGDVAGPRVVGVMAVPRREVGRELQPRRVRRLAHLLDEVALAALPRRVGDGVVRVELARPEAEAIVVLANEDDALDAGRLRRRDPLLCVKLRRVEHRGGRVAVAPLLVGERVEAEVDDGDDLQVEEVLRRLARRGARGGEGSRGKQQGRRERERGEPCHVSSPFFVLKVVKCRPAGGDAPRRRPKRGRTPPP